ncbi:MAG: NADP-dependent oxidoreductase [Actinomycetota bacterium]
MRAMVSTEFGDTEVLSLQDVPRPEPLPTEVLVRVHAAGVNPADAKVRAGLWPVLGQPPFILGWDVSGVVEQVVGVTRFKPGDEVYGMPLFPRAASAYAEYVAAPARQFARKPANLDHTQAAAVPLAGLTALQALVDAGELKQGQRVLIHAAGGGVGHFAVQIAKALGAYVIGTASTDKRDFVSSLGADEVIDYRSADFEHSVSDIDVVLDTVGNGYGERSLRVLRHGGVLVTIVGVGDKELEGHAQAAGRRLAPIMVEPDGAGLERLSGWIEAGLVTPHVQAVYPLQDAAAAHKAIAGGVAGKLVLATI